MLFPSGFDPTIALEAGALVKQAYAQFDQFTAKQPWNLEGPYDALGLLNAKPEELLGHQEPFGFVARSQVSGKVFVTFRGTKSLGDWLSDFSFPQVAHPWGRVEKGFASLCEQCAASVENAVKAARATGPASEVIVTGHSLGAGLAVLATADLAGARAVMYSFAGPRVGDLAFASEFNKNVAAAWRIVNTEDIVTTVPLATGALSASRADGTFALLMKTSPQLNYEHVGVAVCFTNHTGSIEGNHGMLQYLGALNGT